MLPIVLATLLAVIVAQSWLIVVLLRRHGRTLLDHDRLTERLVGVERTLDELADWLYGTTAPRDARGHDGQPAAPATPPGGQAVETTDQEQAEVSDASDTGSTSDPAACATLIAASVPTVYMDRLRRRWRQEAVAPAVLPSALPVPPDPHDAEARVEGIERPAVVLQSRREDVRIVPTGTIAPVRLDDAPEAGRFAVYDWATRRIIWQRSWGPLLVEPSGYCLADGCLYLADSAGSGILQIDVAEQTGRVLQRLSHPAFNDLHSVERTRRGLLVASTGVDAILEVDLDGNLLYEWWAGEHGYTRTPSGHERPDGRGQEHRDQSYHTRYHATHLNEVVCRDADERFLVAVLWVQGQVVQIDRDAPPAQQRAEVVLDGLSRPHGLKRTSQGWIVCSSMSGEVILMDEALRVTDRIAYASNWIQDCLMLASGRILLNDAQGHRLVELAGPPWRVESVTPYPNNWRLARLREVPTDYQAHFRDAARSASADRC